MTHRHTPPGTALTELILGVFRLNGALLEAGDALVRDIGLTSARWQVLGAITLEGRALTVAQIARRMGLSRQAVQRVANDLAGAGMIEFTDNPDHKRARLASLTAAGSDACAEADARQVAWVNRLAEALNPKVIAASAGLIVTIDERCRADAARTADREAR